MTFEGSYLDRLHNTFAWLWDTKRRASLLTMQGKSGGFRSWSAGTGKSDGQLMNMNCKCLKPPNELNP